MPARKLQPIQRVRIFEKAVDQLRSFILEGQYKPGEKLPTEQELCEDLDIGRSTIREALRVLESEGLIRTRRGSGTYVASRSFWGVTRGDMLRWLSSNEGTVIQILQVRESIEGLAASLLANKPQEETISKLCEIIDQQKKLIDSTNNASDVDELASLDVQFHVLISNECGNDLVSEITTHIVPSFSEANKAILLVGRKIETMVKEHSAILKSIKAGDAPGAEKAMRAHIVRVRDEICEYLQEACDDRSQNS